MRAPALSGAGIRYRWSDNSTGNTLLVSQTGAYTLQITSDCDSRTLTRQVTFPQCLTIPNVFTPNGDRFNGLFVIAGLQGEDWALTVFNRWGAKVYYTAVYRNDWGAETAPGVYYYLLQNTATGQSYKGWVEAIK